MSTPKRTTLANAAAGRLGHDSARSALSLLFAKSAVDAMVSAWLHDIPDAFDLLGVVAAFARFLLMDPWCLEIESGVVILCRTEAWVWMVPLDILPTVASSGIKSMIRYHVRTATLFASARTTSVGCLCLSEFSHDALLNDDRLRCRVAKVWIRALLDPMSPGVRTALVGLVENAIKSLGPPCRLRAAPLALLQSELACVDDGESGASSPTRSLTLSSRTS
mgnify:CR=1 FL=1